MGNDMFKFLISGVSGGTRVDGGNKWAQHITNYHMVGNNFSHTPEHI